MVFRGINIVSLDSKGRIVIPSRYRDDLVASARGELVITIDAEEKCLLLYPLNTWEIIEAKVEALPSFNPSTRRIQRLLLGHATELTLDNNGRLLLPLLLRKHAEIDKHIILVGQGKKFELWSKEYWDRVSVQWLEQGLTKGEDLPLDLQTLSL